MTERSSELRVVAEDVGVAGLYVVGFLAVAFAFVWGLGKFFDALK